MERTEDNLLVFIIQDSKKSALCFTVNNVQLTHCGRVTQICVFNTVKLGTSASSP